MADQALSSLTNFLLGIVVARSVTVSEFGAFGLAYSIFVLAVGVTRASTSDPLLIRYAEANPSRLRVGISSATGTALLIGLTGGGALIVVGLATGGATAEIVMALGLCLPGLLLQDGWRHGFVAGGRSHLAFLDDLVFLFLLGPTFWVLLATRDPSAADFILGWGLSATVAGLIPLLSERLLPDPRHALRWLRDQGDLAYRYVGEFAAASGALQITMFFVVVFAGLPAVGSLRAGFLLFGPVLVIFQGSMLVLVPEAVRILGRSTAALRRAILILALGLVSLSVAWGFAVALIPPAYGRTLLGSSWPGASALVIPLLIMFAGSGAETAAIVGLRALAAARQSLKASLIEAALTILGGAAGAVLGGVKGAVWWLAGMFWVEAGVWWWQFFKALQGHPGRLGVGQVAGEGGTSGGIQG